MKSFYNRITVNTGNFIRRRHAWVAAGLIASMALMGLGSMLGNSAIVDEVAHIPAAYSYLHYGDYRLNPEHPPLIKDLAAVPLQFMHLKFPDTQTSWTTDTNGEWEAGWNFLYHIGNNADQILFWARLPILLLALAFGVVLYVIVRRRWGTAAGLLTLLFYTFSPNIIAHSTLVTTDLGASVFIFMALVVFVRFIERPSRGNFWWLTLALALAQLAKFSSFLLYPFLGLLALVLAGVLMHPKSRGERIKTYFGGFVGASAVSLIWVWLYYATQVYGMPQAVQDRLIIGSLADPKIHWVAQALLSVNHWPLMKPLVQYILGLVMVFGRVVGGNVTYFDGQVTNTSFVGYFPQLIVMKTQIALLILIVILVGLIIVRISGIGARQWGRRLADQLRRHIMEWTLGLFAAFYFAVSVAGHLNLGIRHVLPIYTPIFVLVAVGTVRALIRIRGKASFKPALAGLALLLMWYCGSTIAAYPNYLSYFNEFIGGGANADKYFSDSSVDWGQDLKRLQVYVAAHPEIHSVGVDYFGGGVPAYYFCPRRTDANGELIATADGYDCSHSVFQEWHVQNGNYTGQYIAVSETFLENDRYYASLYHQVGYGYLRDQQPIAKIGNSIYLFKLY